MIAAVIIGNRADNKFPGRNIFPLLGRPMASYAMLAALHARSVERVFVSTDDSVIARIAERHVIELLERPVELRAAEIGLAEIARQTCAEIQSRYGELEALVLLLSNAPTVTAGMIESAIALLREHAECEAVISVSPHPEFSPDSALRLAEGGLLRAAAPNSGSSEKATAVYFPDALLWAVRPGSLQAAQHAIPPAWLVDCQRRSVLPLVHEGFGDVDYRWQIPGVEEWLRRNGFSEETTPYAAERRMSVHVPPGRTAPTKAVPSRRRVLITTVPFGEPDRTPLDLLEAAGIEYVINPLGRKLKESEVAEMAAEFGVLIAGTETISARVMQQAPHLQLIARVGIGLDGIDLQEARRRGIEVAYTPEPPGIAVAELTVGLILALLRHVGRADRSLRNGVWHRLMGRRLARCTVGVIGVGRVGKRVIRHLQGFAPRILANDLRPDLAFSDEHPVTWTDKDTIYREADIITFHLPLTAATRHLVTARQIEQMQPHAVLINTARGSIIHEADLAEALRMQRLAGAAVDVFEQEPYSGELTSLDTCLLTCHMGSMSFDCRARMEIEATEDAIRFLAGAPLLQPVPTEEYEMPLEVAAPVVCRARMGITT